MRITILALALALTGGLASPLALADACHVTTRSSSAAVPEVETEHCYEFVGASEGDIDWSCSNESTEMLNSQKRKVDQCAADSLGRCEAALTQEALANQRSTGQNEAKPRPAIPNDAKVVTYYYRVDDLAQARTDCKTVGGTWLGEE